VQSTYDVIIIGAGPAGMMAAITAGRAGQSVILVERMAQPGLKLKASGGGRCNLTNTLSGKDFISRYDRNGKFMTPALNALNNQGLIDFFKNLGVECHAPDGFRVFPVSHSSQSIHQALMHEIARLKIKLLTGNQAEEIFHSGGCVKGIRTKNQFFSTNKVILSSGGAGYPSLGGSTSGFKLAESCGHKVTEIFPAMLPLLSREKWVKNCRADTVGKAIVRINLPEVAKLKAEGDLIFTEDGIAGPVILDFAREITPLLSRHGTVPLLINMVKGRNEEDILAVLRKDASQSLVKSLSAVMPAPLAMEICKSSGADPEKRFCALEGHLREQLVKTIAWTPLNIIGHKGFEAAMVTRGGVSLKEIDPQTMQSRLIKGLYFCGEILDLDGPCGGFNLQWCFSSGFLVGKSAPY